MPRVPVRLGEACHLLYTLTLSRGGPSCSPIQAGGVCLPTPSDWVRMSKLAIPDGSQLPATRCYHIRCPAPWLQGQSLHLDAHGASPFPLFPHPFGRSMTVTAVLRIEAESQSRGLPSGQRCDCIIGGALLVFREGGDC